MNICDEASAAFKPFKILCWIYFPVYHEFQFLDQAADSLFTCSPGVFQRVSCTDGVSRLGGTSHSGLVNSTNPELVHASFLEPKYWVAAQFLHLWIAAHPLPLTDIMSAEECKRSDKQVKTKALILDWMNSMWHLQYAATAKHHSINLQLLWLYDCCCEGNFKLSFFCTCSRLRTTSTVSGRYTVT